MQEIEQVDMARPTTKGAWLVTDPRRIPHMIAQALRLAYSGRRGPVHLTIPIDIQQQTLDESEVTYFEPSEYRPGPDSGASEAQVEAVVGRSPRGGEAADSGGDRRRLLGHRARSCGGSWRRRGRRS